MEYDSETGNYYDMARYYSPRLGRFMSPDPADLAAVNPANPQSWNRYAYALNNPTSLTDPTGLSSTPTDFSEAGMVEWAGGYPGDIFDQLFQTVPLVTCVSAGGTYAPTSGSCSVTYQTEYNPAATSTYNPTIPQGPGGPGSGSGGGGSGGTSAKPQTRGQSQSRLVCAAHLADKYSIAGAAGTIGKKGFLANVFNGFAGNSISGVVLMFNNQGNKVRFTTGVANAPEPFGFAVTASATNSVTTPSSILDLGMGAESADTAAATFVGSSLGGIVTGIKLGYDAASFTAAYFLGCQ